MCDRINRLSYNIILSFFFSRKGHAIVCPFFFCKKKPHEHLNPRSIKQEAFDISVNIISQKKKTCFHIFPMKGYHVYLYSINTITHF